ncbi:MAG: hypothetical protein SF187_19470 [Deltaproteobacteria bacterium]|nr:hypothetical protein [Deltaproteobacteria bacterium]
MNSSTRRNTAGGWTGCFLALCLAACRLTDDNVAVSSADGGASDGAVDSFGTDLGAAPRDTGAAEARPLMSLSGEPAVVGCADGTREGFLDTSPAAWPSIAGCAGAWGRPGLTLEAVRDTWCDRGAGNTGTRVDGVGCGAADLCASGWHVCHGPVEVDRLSSSLCESIVAIGVSAFFAVAGGGGVGGDCAFGQAWANDVRGCGSIGHPEGDGCYPLDRRLEFSDCLATQGAWACGGAANHDQEVINVFKPTGDLGGVLCCRDEQ